MPRLFASFRIDARVLELLKGEAEERRLLLEAEGAGDEVRRDLLRQVDAVRRERWSRTEIERKPIGEALCGNEHAAVVILGDPGSGKSTLLRHLALAHARSGPPGFGGREYSDCERLPVFLSLAAYDDMLRRKPDLSLLDFMALYYDQRHSRPGLGPLFQRALDEGRALVLLDGLDEVQEVAARSVVAGRVDSLIGPGGYIRSFSFGIESVRSFLSYLHPNG